MESTEFFHFLKKCGIQYIKEKYEWVLQNHISCTKRALLHNWKSTAQTTIEAFKLNLFQWIEDPDIFRALLVPLRNEIILSIPNAEHCNNLNLSSNDGPNHTSSNDTPQKIALLATLETNPISHNRDKIFFSSNDSLIRLLLEIPVLQTQLIIKLIKKVVEHQNIGREEDDLYPHPNAGNLKQDYPSQQKTTLCQYPHRMVPLLLRQLCWFPSFIDSLSVADAIKELILMCSTNPTICREILIWLPDVLDDKMKNHIFPTLLDILQYSNELFAPILESFSNMQFEFHQLKLVYQICMHNLIHSIDVIHIPLLIKFLLYTAPRDMLPQLVRDIRLNLKIEAFSTTSVLSTNTSSDMSELSLLVECLKAAIRIRHDFVKLFLLDFTISSKPSEHSVLDFWLFLIIYSTSTQKLTLKLDQILRKKLIQEQLSIVLLTRSIVRYGASSLGGFTGTILNLAWMLLSYKTYNMTRPSYSKLSSAAIQFYAATFRVFADRWSRQQVLSQLMAHIGSGDLCQVDNALLALYMMVKHYGNSMENYTDYIQNLVDYLDRTHLTNDQIFQIYLIFSQLAYHRNLMIIRNFQMTRPMTNISIIGTNFKYISTHGQDSAPRKLEAETGKHIENDGESRFAQFLQILLHKQLANLVDTRYRYIAALGIVALLHTLSSIPCLCSNNANTPLINSLESNDNGSNLVLPLFKSHYYFEQILKPLVMDTFFQNKQPVEVQALFFDRLCYALLDTTLKWSKSTLLFLLEQSNIWLFEQVPIFTDEPFDANQQKEGKRPIITMSLCSTNLNAGDVSVVPLDASTAGFHIGSDDESVEENVDLAESEDNHDLWCYLDQESRCNTSWFLPFKGLDLSLDSPSSQRQDKMIILDMDVDHVLSMHTQKFQNLSNMPLVLRLSVIANWRLSHDKFDHNQDDALSPMSSPPLWEGFIQGSVRLFPYPPNHCTSLAAVRAYLFSQPPKRIHTMICSILHSISWIRESINALMLVHHPTSIMTFFSPNSPSARPISSLAMETDISNSSSMISSSLQARCAFIRLRHLVQQKAWLDLLLDHLPDFPIHQLTNLPVAVSNDINSQPSSTLSKHTSTQTNIGIISSGITNSIPNRLSMDSHHLNPEKSLSHGFDRTRKRDKGPISDSHYLESITFPTTTRSPIVKATSHLATTNHHSGDFVNHSHKRHLSREDILSRIRPLDPHTLTLLHIGLVIGVKATSPLIHTDSMKPIDNQGLWLLLSELNEKVDCCFNILDAEHDPSASAPTKLSFPSSFNFQSPPSCRGNQRLLTKNLSNASRKSAANLEESESPSISSHLPSWASPYVTEKWSLFFLLFPAILSLASHLDQFVIQSLDLHNTSIGLTPRSRTHSIDTSQKRLKIQNGHFLPMIDDSQLGNKSSIGSYSSIRSSVLYKDQVGGFQSQPTCLQLTNPCIQLILLIFQKLFAHQHLYQAVIIIDSFSTSINKNMDNQHDLTIVRRRFGNIHQDTSTLDPVYASSRPTILPIMEIAKSIALPLIRQQNKTESSQQDLNQLLSKCFQRLNEYTLVLHDFSTCVTLVQLLFYIGYQINSNSNDQDPRIEMQFLQESILNNKPYLEHVASISGNFLKRNWFTSATINPNVEPSHHSPSSSSVNSSSTLKSSSSNSLPLEKLLLLLNMHLQFSQNSLDILWMMSKQIQVLLKDLSQLVIQQHDQRGPPLFYPPRSQASATAIDPVRPYATLNMTTLSAFYKILMNRLSAIFVSIQPPSTGITPLSSNVLELTHHAQIACIAFIAQSLRIYQQYFSRILELDQIISSWKHDSTSSKPNAKWTSWLILMTTCSLKSAKTMVEHFSHSICEWLCQHLTTYPHQVMLSLKRYQIVIRKIQAICNRIKIRQDKRMGSLVAPVKKVIEQVIAEMRLLGDKYGFSDSFNLCIFESMSDRRSDVAPVPKEPVQMDEGYIQASWEDMTEERIKSSTPIRSDLANTTINSLCSTIEDKQDDLSDKGKKSQEQVEGDGNIEWISDQDELSSYSLMGSEKTLDPSKDDIDDVEEYMMSDVSEGDMIQDDDISDG